jgi:hypothetical protein
MVTVTEEQHGLDEPLAALWAPGSAVLAVGQESTGQQAVAVWQISPEGHPTGSWVVAQEYAYSDADAARQLLVNIERRALVATDPGTLDDVASRITAAAGIDADGWWNKQCFSPTEAFTDVLTCRAEFQATIAAVRQTGRNVAPLRWDRAFPTGLRPSTVAELQQLAGVGRVAGAPVIVEALQMSRMLRWLIALWAQTEQVKNRREYIREEHGEPQALPPSWLTAVTTASTTRLPL